MGNGKHNFISEWVLSHAPIPFACIEYVCKIKLQLQTL